MLGGKMNGSSVEASLSVPAGVINKALPSSNLQFTIFENNKFFNVSHSMHFLTSAHSLQCLPTISGDIICNVWIKYGDQDFWSRTEQQSDCSFLRGSGAGQLGHSHCDYTESPNKGECTVSLKSIMAWMITHVFCSVSLMSGALVPFQNASSPSCVFWEFGNGWSGSGCYVDAERSSEVQTVCLCDHLTNFALLMASVPIRHM